MIISYKHKYIFIKTEKTAGTSIEIALSKYCGEQDVITPISPEDEIKRKELGYRGPQNYLIPFLQYKAFDWARLVSKRRRLAFYNHAPAEFIRKFVSKDVWKSFYKFCFERNPYDKIISWYFWSYKTDPRPTLSEFVQSRGANLIKGFELYTQFGDIVVDDVFRYEELGAAMETIAQKVGLPETPELPHTKASYRKDKRSYRELLSEEDHKKISRVYAREIANFGYEW